MVLCLFLDVWECLRYFLVKLIQFLLLFTLDQVHHVLEWVAILELRILTFAFVQKLEGIVLCVSKKLGNRLQLIMKSHHLTFPTILELEGKKIQHFIRMRHGQSFFIDLIKYFSIKFLLTKNSFVFCCLSRLPFPRIIEIPLIILIVEVDASHRPWVHFFHI